MKNGGSKLEGIRKFKYVILSVFVLAIAFNIFMIFFFNEATFAGFDVSAVGQVIFGIQGNPIVTIIEPKNITYNFTLGTYPMNLSIVTNFNINDYNLYYRLYDVKHNQWAGNWVLFSSNNETFNAVRWQNTIYVNATDGVDSETSTNVSFYVHVNNTAPTIYDVNSQIYVCESGQLMYPYYVVDFEEDMNPLPGGLIDSNLSFTHDKFFSTSNGRLFSTYNYLIFSTLGVLTKGNNKGDVISLNEGSKNFSTAVQAFDGEYPDSVSTNITVLEINNPPVLENIGVQTREIKVWNQGENSTFYKVVSVSDVEYDMTPRWGTLNFNISIKNSTGSSVNLFGITFNGTNAIMNFTANSSVDIGVYDIRICVNDTGITNPAQNLLAVCGQDGSSQTSCDDFSLTITDENRPPSIVDYFPELNLSAAGRSTVYFNITTYDPDGTIPDVYWFIENVSQKYDFGNSISKFNATLPCGFSGIYYVKAEITDGLLNDSVTWQINVSNVACPLGDSGGGSGGGGGGISPICNPRWVCNPWKVCQNTATSLDLGILSGLNYREIQERCGEENLDEQYCGFQIRECVDLNLCNITRDLPEELQYCIYSENPSCSDGIRNCHDDSCELLVDCGGPCGACASCSDKIRNQGEQGVDCGGPCPWQCKASIPLFKKKGVLLGLLITLFLLVAFIIYKLIRVLQYKRKIGEQRAERNI